MSSKQSQVNSFTGGMNTDLHPLTAPNTSLSDCINGTVITYNGNEYVLQNDMGNYQLKNAILSPNYIPIGVKEYGGIIYIVSYNPIDKMTEIGSYPSPKTIYDNSQTNERESKFIELTEEYNNYTVLSTQQSIQLYSADETFKLNPGDKYYLYMQEDEDKIYQTIEFYVLSEDKNLYSLRDIVKTHTTDQSGSDDFDNVTWEVPGWLAYKFRIATLDQFNLYLIKLKQPGFFGGDEDVALDYAVSAQAITSDLLFDNQALLNKLKVWIAVGYLMENGVKRYFYWHESNDWVLDYVDWAPGDGFDAKAKCGKICDINKVKYTSINKFLFTKDVDPSEEEFKKLKILIEKDKEDRHTIFVEAVPMIQNAENNKHIIYDNFEQTLTIDLDNIGDFDEVKAFEEYYKYIVSENEITFNFDITSPTTSLDSLSTEFRIYKITARTEDDDYDLKLAYSQELDEVNYLGQNIISCQFNTDECIDPEREGLEAEFDKENIYLVQLRIYMDETKQTYKNWHRILIGSELMNSFYNSKNDFSEILMKDWIGNLKDYIAIPEVSLIDKKTTVDNMALIRNESLEDSRIYRLEEETKGKDWRLDYDMTNPISLHPEDEPAIGVKTSDDFEIENYQLNVFDDQGMWSGEKDLSFKYEIQTNNGSMIFDKDHLTSSVDFYTKYILKLREEGKKERQWDRVYMYDYCFGGIRADRHKKNNPGNYYWCNNYYQVPNAVYFDRFKRLYYEVTHPPMLDITTIDNETELVSWREVGSKYDWYSTLPGTDERKFSLYSPFVLMYYSSHTGGTEHAEGWVMKDFYDDSIYNKKISTFCCLFKTKINDQIDFVAVPISKDSMTLHDDKRYDDEDTELVNYLLTVMDEMAVHLFCYIPSKSEEYKYFYLLIPSNINTESVTTIALKNGTYTWNFKNFKWNGDWITNNRVSETTLLLNGVQLIPDEEVVSFANLQTGDLSTSNSLVTTLDKTINVDLTGDFNYTDYDDPTWRVTNLNKIHEDITKLKITLQNKSAKREELINKNNDEIQDLMVDHDLNEIEDEKHIELGSLKSDYDYWKGFLKAQRTDGTIEFYIQEGLNLDTIVADQDRGGWEYRYCGKYIPAVPAMEGYHLPSKSDSDLLWDNVSEKFKSGNGK
ncbi:MAG: hypothetical protein KBT03_08980 [Bacteroidales bacterium]|nr:hypothetical protein [Candidatus Scybalousia scybalohippi]